MMSFSKEVKKELASIEVRARHCKIAELAALVIFSGRIRITENGGYRLILQTENRYVIRRFSDFVQSLMGISPEVSMRCNQTKKTRLYFLLLRGEEAKNLLVLTKLLDESGEIRGDMHLVSNWIVQNSCCKRAFIRGSFLVAGSISDPEKGYHFEIVTMNEEKAKALQSMLESFQIKSKIVKRKNHFPVYLKEGEQLSLVLSLMEASLSLMKYENVRIVKDVRNRVNRSVNLETANLSKTAKAAAKQILDIEYIKKKEGLHILSEALCELAELRLLYREASLKELGTMLSRPVGKSGVNHRLNKISLIAEEIRMEKGEI